MKLKCDVLLVVAAMFVVFFPASQTNAAVIIGGSGNPALEQCSADLYEANQEIERLEHDLKLSQNAVQTLMNTNGQLGTELESLTPLSVSKKANSGSNTPELVFLLIVFVATVLFAMWPSKKS